jgi:hypothetical protein
MTAEAGPVVGHTVRPHVGTRCPCRTRLRLSATTAFAGIAINHVPGFIAAQIVGAGGCGRRRHRAVSGAIARPAESEPQALARTAKMRLDA